MRPPRPALLLLLALLPLGVTAGQPDPSGQTETTVEGADVTVRPGGFVPMPFVLRYSYVPAAAAASQGPTTVNVTFDVGDGLIVQVERDPLVLEVPVAPTASPPTGATVEVTVEASVYCYFPGILTFPEGVASVVVVADAQANGLLKPSQGFDEIVVTCENPNRTNLTTEVDASLPDAGVPPPEDRKDAPLGLGVPAAALGVAAVSRACRRGR